MALKSFLIAPFTIGEETDVKPFLLPEDAFTSLENAYVWRGRVKKRWGTSLLGSTDLLSRLRVNIDTTDGSGNASGTVPGATFKVGQLFSIGSEYFTVNATGTPANMLISGSATSATFNTTTGAYVFTGAAATTDVYFYPAEPVMGLIVRENDPVNQEETVAFDTQFAYQRSAGGWERLGTAIWSGNSTQFVWGTNYRGANPYDTYLYVTNYKALSGGSDGIKYLPAGSTTWTDLRPQLDAGATRFLEGCRILVGFKDRLVALNTLETQGGVQTFSQRCRFSINGNPVSATTSWLDDTPGVGGYIDAPTKEAIISAQLLRDRLIVYFEQSTWELVYTKDNILPFRWQQLNSELGCESTFSIIGFDDAAVGVGNRGIHACSGNSVVRIDEKIPDKVFEIHNANGGVERVYGIRDYVPELVYWTFPDFQENPTFPNRVLIYNYINGTWAFFRDSFTCFGYFQRDADVTWDELTDLYGIWDNWNDPWNTGAFQSAYPLIAAGNQEGFTFIVDTDKSSNASSLQITDLTPSSTVVIVDHNLLAGDYLLIENCTGITSLNDTVVEVISVVDASTVTIDTSFTGTYTGGGTAARVSTLNALSKQFNPGTPIGQQFSIPYIDLLLTRTDAGAISCDYFVDSNTDSSVQDLDAGGALLGTNTVSTAAESPQEEFRDAIWHRYFMNSEAQFLQLQFFLSDSQLRDYPTATSFFELQAMILYVEAGGRLVS